MSFISRQAAIVARNPAEAAFAEATIASYGFQVARYDSPASLTQVLQQQLSSNPTGVAPTPAIAILAGSCAEFANGSKASVGAVADMVPVVIATSESTVADAVELMKHGVKDVVELPCPSDDLWQRLSATIERSEAEASCKAKASEMRTRFDTLTPAENEVVDAMLDGLANKQIAQRLGIGLRTVELRRSKIMRKMQARSVAELVKFICMSGVLQQQLQPTEA